MTPDDFEDVLPDKQVTTWEFLPAQRDFFESADRHPALISGIGFGKALALDTPIPTTEGWVQMGEIRPDTVVFDESGNPCTVIAVSHVFNDRPCNEVIFDDGSVIVADDSHEWLAWSRAARRAIAAAKPRSLPAVVTTSHMRNTLRHQHNANWSVSVAGALNSPEQDLPLPPYVLGAWLGDGDSHGSTITCYDDQILDEVRREGISATPLTVTHRYGLGLKPLNRDASNGRMLPNGSVMSTLREMGLLQNKHIPSSYLRASAKQRMDLLQGLMDTDGHISLIGQAEFTSVNVRLAHQVMELVVSLGFKAVLSEGRASISGRDCGPKYRITWKPDRAVCRLERKVARHSYGRRQWHRTHHRYVVDIRRIESVPVRCIVVDSPSRLFLAGKAMIPTHNSKTGARKGIRLALSNPGSFGMVTAPSYTILRDATFKTYCDELLELGIPHKVHRSAPQEIILPNRSDIAFRSTDNPELLRGPNLLWAHMDEEAMNGDTAFKIMQGRIRQRGAGGSPNQLFVTSTPKGKNWIWERWERDKRDGYHLYKGRTRDNLFLPPEYIEALYGDYDEEFASQELDGEFTSFKGVVFPTFQPSLHRWDGELPKFQRMYGALDFGSSNPYAHMSAGIVVGVSGGRNYYVAEFEDNGDDIDNRQIEWMVEQEQRWGKIQWCADRTQFRGNSGLRKMGFTITPSKGIEGSRDWNIRSIQRKLKPDPTGRPGLYYLPTLKLFVAHMERYRWVEPKTADTPGKREPLRVRDDLMDCILYAEEVIGRPKGDPDNLQSFGEMGDGTEARRPSWKEAVSRAKDKAKAAKHGRPSR